MPFVSTNSQPNLLIGFKWDRIVLSWVIVVIELGLYMLDFVNKNAANAISFWSMIAVLCQPHFIEKVFHILVNFLFEVNKM